ncbi:MAG TPA: cysteine synthase A [Acetobacteraceae bacterium]|nr:cysteine synthase A [Acetobacteraceae bacterium]
MSRRRLSATKADPVAADLAPARGRIYPDILATIGGTPLVRAPRLAAAAGLVADLTLKLEFFNPMGSVKDRIGLAMVVAAEQAGEITPGRSVLIEPTSGDTGLALALVAAARGYRLIVTMPEGAAPERRRLLRLMGAEVELTPAHRGMTGAIERAQVLLDSVPHAWMPRQFDNPANPAAHAASTAEEIWADTAGRVDLVVGGLGTGGTLSGIARALKPRRPTLRVYGVEPAESAVLSGDEPGPHGIQGLGPGFCPAVLDLDRLDGVIRVSEHEAVRAARHCARQEGLAIGLSAGAALHAALALGREAENARRLLVVLIPCSAERSLSTGLFAGL